MTLTALYPGSFDPITNGHLDIITRALGVVDRLIIGIARNARKEALFSVEERADLIRQALVDFPQVEVHSFEGLTVQYAAHCGARMIVRGLRAVADFEYELQMANMNRKLDPQVETYFMMTSEKFFFVSSQNVKEVAGLGGDVSCLVPAHVAQRLSEKFSG